MFSISARSLYELSNVASMVSCNASAFIEKGDKRNRKDLLLAVNELQNLALNIMGEAFEGVAAEELKANQAEIRQAFEDAKKNEKRV